MIVRALALLTLSLGVATACPTHAVPLPTELGKGEPGKKVEVLLDTPFVKLVSITLRGGTTLPDHAVGQAITLQALVGNGTVTVGEEKTELSEGQMMLVAPGAKHSVTPTGSGDLVVLLHFLPSPGAGSEGAKCPHCDGADHAGHEHPKP